MSSKIHIRLTALSAAVVAGAAMLFVLLSGNFGGGGIAQAQTTQCVTEISGAGQTTVDDSWTADCVTTFMRPHETSTRDRYARFYTFTLPEYSMVEATTSSMTDTYLLIRSGAGMDGDIIDSNDDAPGLGLNSRLMLGLHAGTYTIEVTTYISGVLGDFNLEVDINASDPPDDDPAPTPMPSPTPMPTDALTEAACEYGDLAHIQGLNPGGDNGPNYFPAGYSGNTGLYFNTWATRDGLIVICLTEQYNTVENARWNALNYNKVIQYYGVYMRERFQADGLTGYEQQLLSGNIGDDSIAFSYEYEAQGQTHRVTEVRFLNADTRTVSIIFFWVIDQDYQDVAAPEMVANNVANRVMGGSPHQGMSTVDAMLDSMHLR